jgi:hypothetical protein
VTDDEIKAAVRRRIDAEEAAGITIRHPEKLMAELARIIEDAKAAPTHATARSPPRSRSRRC